MSAAAHLIAPAHLAAAERLLAALTPDRRAHSLAAGARAASAAHLLPVLSRRAAITAATLHDVGYGAATTGFHPLDGAAALAEAGFGSAVVALVGHHTAARMEAEVRGIDAALLPEPTVATPAAHALLWWADLTTGPTGLTVSAEDRIAEIRRRYSSADPVATFIDRAAPLLLRVGSAPRAGIPVSYWDR